jgi:hypothetical protein
VKARQGNIIPSLFFSPSQPTTAPAHLVYNPLAPEPHIPKTQPHISVKAQIHPPPHPAHILPLSVDAVSQPCEGHRAWAREVVEVARWPDAFTLSPGVICSGDGLLGVSDEGAVVECFKERWEGGEGLVVVDELWNGGGE